MYEWEMYESTVQNQVPQHRLEMKQQEKLGSNLEATTSLGASAKEIGQGGECPKKPDA